MMNKIWTILLLSTNLNLYAASEILEQALVMENLSIIDIPNPLKFESSSVKVVVLKGTLVHIADYKKDNTRVATCLDGEYEGQQAIAVNGIKTHESTKVKWYKDHFTHKYPHAKVTSYPTQQTIELKP